MAITNVGLKITSEGIFDNTHGYGFIPWEKIIKIERNNWASINAIITKLYPSFIASLPLLTRIFAEYGIRNGIDPQLNIGFLNEDPEYIFQLMENKLSDIKKTV